MSSHHTPPKGNPAFLRTQTLGSRDSADVDVDAHAPAGAQQGPSNRPAPRPDGRHADHSASAQQGARAPAPLPSQQTMLGIGPEEPLRSLPAVAPVAPPHGAREHAASRVAQAPGAGAHGEPSAPAAVSQPTSTSFGFPTPGPPRAFPTPSVPVVFDESRPLGTPSVPVVLDESRAFPTPSVPVVFEPTTPARLAPLWKPVVPPPRYIPRPSVTPPVRVPRDGPIPGPKPVEDRLLSAIVIFLLSIMACAGTAVAFGAVTQVRAAALLPFLTSPAPKGH